jgi:hypothetical protein
MSEPSTFYAKPRSDRGEKISMLPLGITGLPTEPYSYHNNVYYEGIGGEGEMSWFSLIAIILLVVGFLGGSVYLYLWYSKASTAAGILGVVAKAIK